MITMLSDQFYEFHCFKDTTIDAKNLIARVFEKNRRGEEKVITKIVCPFCFTLVAPQLLGSGRMSLQNFNRHLKLHRRRAN